MTRRLARHGSVLGLALTLALLGAPQRGVAAGNEGEVQRMIESLRRVIVPAPDDLVVLPGHGPQTTIGQEKAANPYLVPLLADGDVPRNPRGL